MLCIPRGERSTASTTATIVDAKMLLIVSPGILGPDDFREIAAVAKAEADGPPGLRRSPKTLRWRGCL